jgi:peptide/nickel transport system permease protein
MAWRSFFRRTSNLVGLALVLMFMIMAIFAPVLAPPVDPDVAWPFKSVGRSFGRQPFPPSAESPLGTTMQIQDMPQYGFAPDQDASFHWDVYYTLVWGSRSALRFGLTVTALTAVLGILIGVVSGYLGGVTSMVTMRLTDAFLAFPAIAGIWVIQRTFFGTIYNPFNDPALFTGWDRFLYGSRIDPTMITLILFSWMPYARLMNSQVRKGMSSEYVRAAQSMGATGPRIMSRHLLPNTISPAIVLAARDVGGMVVLACAFIFIGFGGNVAWGTMLVASRDFVIGLAGNPFEYWWTFVPVSLALILFGVGWNLLGDGLNTLLNPHER